MNNENRRLINKPRGINLNAEDMWKIKKNEFVI
jgi:hypothetical protein